MRDADDVVADRQPPAGRCLNLKTEWKLSKFILISMHKTKVVGRTQNQNLCPASVPRGDQMKVLGRMQNNLIVE